MESSRYLFRSSDYRTDRKPFDLDDALSSNSKNINDEEFLCHFRVSRESFFLLLDELKDKLPFKNTPQKKNRDQYLFNY